MAKGRTFGKTGSQPPKVSGRQLRKERRKEERANSKKRAAPLVPNFEGHDSDVRSTRRRIELFVEASRRTISKEEERLREWKPPKTPEELEAERLKKRGSGLRGAAKPAWEKYPELYPEMHKEEPPEPTFDLIEQYKPNCFANDETCGLIGHYFQLGHALLQDDKKKSKGKEAQDAFKACLELEKSDPFGARYGYLIASLERGQVIDEWKQILNSDFLDSTVEKLYNRALLSHLSRATEGGEDDEKEDDEQEIDFNQALQEAVEACPEVAFALVHQDIMSVVVDPGMVLGWIREKREQLVEKATSSKTSNREAGLCDVGFCISPEAKAVGYYVCFGQYWTDKDLMEALSEAIESVELDHQPEDENQDEDRSANEDHEAWVNRSLTRMFHEASLKF